MKLELRVYKVNDDTDSGFELVGGVAASTGGSAEYTPGATRSTLQIINEVSMFTVKRPTDMLEVLTELDGIQFVAGLALFYLSGRNVAYLFADGEQTTVDKAVELAYPGFTERE